MEKAEKLARGAALKWASGVFYRPEKLEGLGHYRNRETQRNSSIQSRLKVGVCHVPPNGCSQLHTSPGSSVWNHHFFRFWEKSRPWWEPSCLDLVL